MISYFSIQKKHSKRNLRIEWPQVGFNGDRMLKFSYFRTPKFVCFIKMMKILQNDCNLWNTEFHTLSVRWSPVITTVLNQSWIKRIRARELNHFHFLMHNSFYDFHSLATLTVSSWSVEIIAGCESSLKRFQNDKCISWKCKYFANEFLVRIKCHFSTFN